MKLLRLASLAIATAVLLPAVTSCDSDPNPFDKVIIDDQQETALIKINLSVAGTRAGETTPAVDAMATDEEKLLTKVNLYVFNEKHQLEMTIPNVAIGSGETSVTVGIPSHGSKTIYALTAQAQNNALINPTAGTSASSFEMLTFPSTLDRLRTTSDGFVMFGKSGAQQVMVSATEEALPSSNEFSIELTRLVAKAQVLADGLNGSNFGFELKDLKFRAMQTNPLMRLIYNGSDVHTSYSDANGNGTYDVYTIGNVTTNEFQNAVTTAFKPDGCAYMPENIVSSPKSGNTTFLSIRVTTKPAKYYSFAATDESPKAMEDTPTDETTYYVVGMIDRQYGIADYTVDGSDNKVMAFKDEADARRYATKLNTGQASPITVSQTESQLKPPATRAGEEDTPATPQFEVFTYDKGYAYYRVNIAHEESSGDSTVLKNKVVRNKFYKVTINSVKNLGVSAEDLLRPTKADAALDAHGSCWISASFTVAPWDSVTQSVDLE